MKFVMIKEFSWNLSKDKVIIGEISENKIKYYTDGTSEPTTIISKLSIAYLQSMGDFNEDEEYNIVLNTSSIQIRPKAIYKNSKGYYKKEDGKRVFFNNEDTYEIEEAINKFKLYLSERGDCNCQEQ